MIPDYEHRGMIVARPIIPRKQNAAMGKKHGLPFRGKPCMCFICSYLLSSVFSLCQVGVEVLDDFLRYGRDVHRYAAVAEGFGRPASGGYRISAGDGGG